MAKQGQHRHDGFDQAKSRGPNNDSQSQTITTGTPKKQATYQRQAAEGRDPGKQAQAARRERNEDTRDKPSIENSPRARDSDLSNRASVSSPTGRTTAPDEGQLGQSRMPGSQHPDQWRHDLNPEPLGGQNVGQSAPIDGQGARSAYDDKAVHNALREFTDDALDSIPVLTEGSRLKQGATYVDLHDQSRAELKARGDLVVGPGQWLVAKDSVDYQLWNRLIGVKNPERLGEADDSSV
jgi:hypothetical protein